MVRVTFESLLFESESRVQDLERCLREILTEERRVRQAIKIQCGSLPGVQPHLQALARTIDRIEKRLTKYGVEIPE